MSNLFHDNPAFNKPLNLWNTSNVTSMASMFQSSKAFNQDISSWNTSKVTNMNLMFNDASAFNQNISGWNVALTPTRPSLTYNFFANSSPLELPENSHKLPQFE